MSILNGERVIAIEEHYYDEELSSLFTGIDAGTGGWVRDALLDTGEGRIKSMDECHIDTVILSHGAPSTQKLDAATGKEMAVKVNDRLAEMCKAFPGRYEGFAALPTADPAAAADELSRCVEELGFKGAMIHGLVGGDEFIDEERFWPVFERAEKLGYPIYIHPANINETVADIYLRKYAEQFPGIMNAGWGFTFETATIAIRMVLSGMFEKFPSLKIILGHLGETIPFLLWRIDSVLNRPGNSQIAFRDIFTSHFYVTPSGFFSDPALLCVLQEMGADRVLFAIDYPFVKNEPGPIWMERLMLNAEDKSKILHGNAERLMKM